MSRPAIPDIIPSAVQHRFCEETRPWRTVLGNVAFAVGSRHRVIERALPSLAVIGLADIAGVHPASASASPAHRRATRRCSDRRAVQRCWKPI